jgi:hypothetical protein
MPQLRPPNFCRHHQRIHTPADDMLLGAARGAMLKKTFPWIVFFGVLPQPAYLHRLFLRAGPRLSSLANSLWDSCRLLRSLRQALVEVPQRFRKPPCEAGRFCGSFSLFRDSLVPRRCETLKANRRSVSGSSLLGSKWNIPAGLRTMTSPALQPSGLWLTCPVGVKAHRTFRSGNYYASGVNLSLLLGKFLLP